jgi:hypothetical protein
LPSSARCGFFGGFFGYSGSLNRSIRFSLALNGAAYFLRDIHRDGA